MSDKGAMGGGGMCRMSGHAMWGLVKGDDCMMGVIEEKIDALKTLCQ